MCVLLSEDVVFSDERVVLTPVPCCGDGEIVQELVLHAGRIFDVVLALNAVDGGPA
jgi:hypothetical protein